MKFKPPTKDEAVEYAKSIGYNTFDYNVWFHFYNSKGWKVGKTKMTSWKSAVWTFFCGTLEYREMKRKEWQTETDRNRLRAEYGNYIKTASEIKLKEMRKARELEHLYWLIDELRPEIKNKLKEK